MSNLLFDIKYPLSRRIKMWNELKPATIERHKDAIVAYIRIFPESTYDEIYQGLNAVGYKIKLTTVAGRLSDLVKDENSVLDTSAEKDGCTAYKLKEMPVESDGQYSFVEKL